MPARKLTSDSDADMARYHALMNKASLLYGQGQKVAEIAGSLDAMIEGLEWQGKRATRFRKEWTETHHALSQWASSLLQLAEEVRDEAKNYLKDTK